MTEKQPNQQPTQLPTLDAALLALTDMCVQYCSSDPEGLHLHHDFMSAGEGAFDVLMQAGLLEQPDKRVEGYVVNEGAYAAMEEEEAKRREAKS